MDEATYTARITADDRPLELLVDIWADGAATVSFRRPGQSWSAGIALNRCQNSEVAS